MDRQCGSGALYVVATPIGNLDDVSARALQTLESVDRVLAEDTRVTRRLLDRHGIRTRVSSLHAGNEATVSARAVAALEGGERIALVSDAGTPLLSDPGFELVRAARAAGVPVHAVPGPSAITAALSVAGLPTTRFLFEGFLPAKREARRARLATLAGLDATLVLFEAPHRVAATLADLVDTFGGERRAAFARELTKLHEEVCTDTLSALATRVETVPPRGEFVLLVAAGDAVGPSPALLDGALDALDGVLPTREAAALIARLTGARRNDVYERAIARRRER